MRKVLMAICAAVFLVSLVAIIMHFSSERRDLDFSSHVRETVRLIMEQPSEEAAFSGETQNLGLDFDALRAFFGNEDIIAHLHIPGTNIDYLVVQTTDNAFYVDHDIRRNPAASGWIFLDYEADVRSVADHQWIIYGHNMRLDHMFHAVRHFTSPVFFRQHRIMILTTPYGVYEWEIFSFYSTYIDFEYNIVNFACDLEWGEMLDTFVRLSRHDAGILVDTSDRVLTLSTCTGRVREERFVLHGRLIQRRDS